MKKTIKFETPNYFEGFDMFKDGFDFDEFRESSLKRCVHEIRLGVKRIEDRIPHISKLGGVVETISPKNQNKNKIYVLLGASRDWNKTYTYAVFNR